MFTRRLDELLLAEGLVDEQSLSLARTEALARQRTLAEIVIDLGLIDERSLASLLARESGLELVSPIETASSTAISGLVPLHLARRHQVIPLRAEPDTIVIAMIDPLEPGIVEIIAAATGTQVGRAVGVRSEIEKAVLELYGVDEAGDHTIQASRGSWLDEVSLAASDPGLPGGPDDWQAVNPPDSPTDESDSDSRDADRTAPSTAGHLSDTERLAHVERQLFSVSRALAIIQARLDTIDSRIANLGGVTRAQK
jgi:type IV pilus assembly protein PilB